MRPIALLIAGMLIASFVAGALSLSYRWKPEEPPDFATLSQIKKEFTEKHAPLARIDLGILFPADRPASFLDPAARLPSTTRYPFAEISALHRYAGNCDGKELSLRSPRSTLAKAWLWHEFQCGKADRLPHDFFVEKPWFHPAGSSFVYLAWKSARNEFTSQAWLATNLGWIHASEYALLPGASLTIEQKFLSSLDRNELAELFDGASLILTPKSLWIRVRDRREISETSPYDIFQLDDFRKTLRARAIAITPLRPGKGCLLQEGNACWEFDLESLAGKTRISTLLFTALTLLLAGLVAWKLILIIRRDRAEEERKRFALQALAHELRTPITTLALSVETLRTHFDAMPEAAQDASMRVFDGLQRLLRLVERSRSYLKVSSGKLLELTPARIPSLKSFLEELLSEAGETATLEVAEDRSITQDPYWLAIAIRNVLRNAGTHGVPPVRVRLEWNGNQARILVIDQGTGPLAVAAESGSGWGIGLVLVRRILEELGGRLEFKPSPTTFTLVIPNG